MWVGLFFTLLNDMVMLAEPFKWRPCLRSYQQSKTAEECGAFPIFIPSSFTKLAAQPVSICSLLHYIPDFFLSHLPTILSSGFCFLFPVY